MVNGEPEVSYIEEHSLLSVSGQTEHGKMYTEGRIYLL